MIIDTEIRTRSCPECYLCGSAGKPLYNKLNDSLFGVSGDWNLRRCINQGCGLVWLDPMPLEEDIGKAYGTYYTHSEADIRTKEAIINRILRWNLKQIYNLLKYITLIHYGRRRLNLMYMNKVKSGKLLEVGCGGGRRLSKMRALGWEVEGQEVDPRAAKHASDVYGFTIHLSSLKDIAFKENSFDAIIANHVIEHVYEPDLLLSECYRILKPGGIMVVVTPNVDCFGHRYFGSNWRGLEPPRHLHLFSQKTIKLLAERSGFHKIETWTTMAKEEVFAMSSLDILYEGSHRMGATPKLKVYILGILFQLMGTIIHIVKSDAGAECVLKVQK
ncbi:MAG: class I SAM-dependent methyltransferase [Nitrospira sp.]|nr:class I SAM-dependent methyltransferase [Nitrospira sp.]